MEIMKSKNKKTLENHRKFKKGLLTCSEREEIRKERLNDKNILRFKGKPNKL